MSYKFERKMEMREVVVSSQEWMVCDACPARLSLGDGGVVTIPDGWVRTYTIRAGPAAERHFCPACAPKALAALDALKEPKP